MNRLPIDPPPTNVSAIPTGIRGDRNRDVRLECPADGCTEEITFDKLACFKHWRMVPRGLQSRVIAAWHRRLLDPSDQQRRKLHREVADEAIAYMNRR